MLGSGEEQEMKKEQTPGGGSPITYFGNPVRPALPHMEAGQIGCIITPNQHNPVPAGATWCADNGCGPTKKGQPGAAYPGDTAFLAFLEAHLPEAGTCAFATAPDVLGDAQATLTRSLPMLPKIRALGYKAALVAQDGLELLEVPWDAFDVLFIGGSTEWKMSPAAAKLIMDAHMHGKAVHFGRVNSLLRLRYADSLYCDSADGTYLTFCPTPNTAKVLYWLTQIEADHNVPQSALALAA
jgi:hypothetical protein